jgi:hypothetical protein
MVSDQPTPDSESPNNNSISDSINNPIRPEAFERFAKTDSADSTDVMQGLKAATVYIDNRNIGNYFEQEAQIHGSVTGRDANWRVSHASPEIVGQILAEHIEKIGRVYVEPSRYSQARLRLNEYHILVLQGQANFGKQTTALHLLNELCDRDILEMNPAIADLSQVQCLPNHSYLIDTLTPTENHPSKLEPHTLKQLSRTLQQIDSYLVITIDEYWEISQALLDDYVLTWNELPTCEKALEKHLRWNLKAEAPSTEIQALLQTETVQDLLTNKLLPKDIDRLSELLSTVVNQELTLEEALSQFSIRVRQQVELWFHDHLELKQRLFFITLAVLSGSKYKAVDDASQRLFEIAQSCSNSENTSIVESVFDSPRRVFLKDVCASVEQGLENTERGRSPIEIIKLDNTAFQPEILFYAWHEYNRLRDPLLTWLYELGSHPNLDLRIKAAAAVGELSKYDFTAVLDKVLRPWANAQEPKLQKLAALSLSIPVFDSLIAPQVLGLLHSWSGLRNNPRLRFTATIAYGGIGLRFLDVAMRDLFAIAQSANESLFSAVAESITLLFQADKFAVLLTIQSWNEQARTTDETQFSLMIFWLLMHRATRPEGHLQWSTMLWLLWQEREQIKQSPHLPHVYEDVIHGLIQQSLRFRSTRSLVLEELHRWLQLSDSDRRLYPILGRLFYQLMTQGTDHERQRLMSYLKRWALNAPDNTASKIYRKLNGF